MKTATIQLETLTCPSCIAKIESALKQTKGISEAKVLFNASKVKATYDENTLDKGQITSIIAKLGYRAIGEG